MHKLAISAPPFTTGQIVFVQNHIPALQAGEYMLRVEESLKNTDPKNPASEIDETYVNTRRFAVTGSRFRLPPDGVYSIFPPVNAQGEYVEVLPHVVLNSRTLPWQRSLDGTDNGTPWLAVLLFDQDDPPPALQTVQLGDLQRASFPRSNNATESSKSTLPTDAVSYPDAYPGSPATLPLDYGENVWDACQVIDLPIDLFRSIAPTALDMQWLAHARTVTTAFKEGDRQPETRDFSVTVGNRFAKSNSRSTAHLVSLEQLAAFLPLDGGNAPPILLANGTPASLIRLVSLKSWSFTSVDPRESFTGYLEGLDVGALRMPLSQTDDSPSGHAVANAFALGYTAMQHHTRLADRTVSWCRGPFVPFTAPETALIPVPDPQAKPPVTPVATADALTRYDPSTGMFDVTYAAAWEIGRLLALRSGSFSQALYNWKRSVEASTILAFERQILLQELSPSLNLDIATMEKQGPVATQDAAAEFIIKRLGNLITRRLDEDDSAS